MKNTEMEWRESIIKGYEINDIIIDISYTYTNTRPYINTVYKMYFHSKNFKIHLLKGCK